MSDASELAPRPFPTGPEAAASDDSGFDDPLIGRLLDGRYRVLERLAEGGMGTIYRAEHIALRKEVAIKLVQDGANSDHALRFLREAMMTSRIDHPNVISAIDYGTFEDGAAYLVLNLIEGPTLAHVMEFERPMLWMRAAEIAAQIADAVAAAQAQGIVHRDLKPENLVLQPMPDGTDVVKVLDFGIAKYARDSLAPPSVRGAQHVTRLGVVVGTPGYMAPEQAVGMRADHRADLYSIGVMLWECIVGRRLWDYDDVQQLLTAQLGSRAPSLRETSGDTTIPAALDELVAELLATRPEKRPQSAVEARDRLRALAEAEWRESKPRVILPPIAEPRLIVVTPPPLADLLEAAIARRRGAAVEVPRQPTTQLGFRAVTRVLQSEEAASSAATNAQPRVEPEPQPASAPALRQPLPLRAALPIALAVASAVLWAVLVREPSAARSTTPARGHGTQVAAHEVSGTSGATPAGSAPSPQASAAAMNATAALPVSVRPAVTNATSHTARASSLRTAAKPERADALRAKARAYFRRAEFELATQTYRLAIKAAPGYAGAYAGLGASQLALGDARGAIASYRLAIRRSPATSGFHAALGRAYIMTGDRARALASYSKAVALDPSNEVAASALARLAP